MTQEAEILKDLHGISKHLNENFKIKLLTTLKTHTYPVYTFCIFCGTN